MGTPNYILQGLSTTFASYGAYFGLNTADGGTTGSNEATGGGYARQLSPGNTPDGAGDNTFVQVNVPCQGGTPGTTYTGASVWSTLSNVTLAVPSGVTAAGSTTGGTLAANTYFYVVTAFNVAGETTKSAEVSATTTGTTSSVAIGWSHISGVYDLATLGQQFAGYKIYRGTASGSENVLVATVAASATTWTDTGVAGTAGAPPQTNGAYTFISYNEFDGGPVTVVGTNASINVDPTTTVLA